MATNNPTTALSKQRVAAVLVAALLGLLCQARSAAACDTPVYRYATYNWTPSPYRIYYIARGETLPQDHPVRQAIAELAPPPTVDSADGKAASQAAANIELFEIDAAAEDPFALFPPPLRGEAAFVLDRATSGDDPPELPRFAVVLPHGYPVYEGPLTEADIRAIADSPARGKIVDAIASGKAAVMLLLEGDKADDNAAAEKLIGETIARAAGGQLSPPPDPALSTTAADAKPASVDVGVVRIRRDDPAEKWLVMSLLHVEPENAERTEPMVFTVFACGRVNPPAIGVNVGDGRGICAEQLDQEVRFVLGPCACEIKDHNPGMDLALVADWNAIALTMAKRFGSEKGNEHLLDVVPGLFPEIVDIGPSAQNPAEIGLASDPPAETGNENETPSDGDAQRTNDAPIGPSAQRSTASRKSPDELARDAGAPEGFRTGMSLEEATRKDTGNAALMRNVGIGVLVVMLLLGVASISLFRRPA
ncbi:MAG: hypothetical protein WD875_16035 [Pirellulales bacterium]